MTLLLTASGLLNLLFYIFAVGFLISLGLEQYLKVRPLSPDTTMNDRNMYIVQSNRKYCWKQAWVANLAWFICNIALYFAARNVQAPVDTFWNGI